MAQRKCKDCGQLVSTTAKTCPGCGSTRVNEDLEAPGQAIWHMNKMRKYLMPVAIILAVIGIAGFVAAGKPMHYVYSILCILGAVVILGFPVYFNKKMNKTYAEIYSKVVIKD